LQHILDLGWKDFWLDINLNSIKFANPLIMAVRMSNTNAMRILLANGADPNLIYNRSTILTFCITQERITDSRILLQNRANPNLAFSNAKYLGHSSLIYAILSLHFIIIRTLFSYNIKFPVLYFSFQTNYTNRFYHGYKMCQGPPGIHVQIKLESNKPGQLMTTTIERKNHGRVPPCVQTEQFREIEIHSGVSMTTMLEIFKFLINRGVRFYYVPLDSYPIANTQRIENIDPELLKFYMHVEKKRKQIKSLFFMSVVQIRKEIQGHPLSKQLAKIPLPAHLIDTIINLEY
jgi:hypothetical protein